MQEQSHSQGKAFAAGCFVLMMLIQQVATSPVPDLDASSGSVQRVERSLRRTARMTPLWRIMGTKPQGAYCQNNYECSTGTCKKGHCSFSHPLQS
ncbi:liver-expressed antimicrobial peptide 2 [Brachyhypopomus gauderio]|uniref:liver-expressed antimicrobial peptide 2 n=1 Tax=Brachyhypopomus gauderio TaxID=698409 RepID=UPI004041A667